MVSSLKTLISIIFYPCHNTFKRFFFNLLFNRRKLFLQKLSAAFKADPVLASSGVVDLHHAGRAEELMVSSEGDDVGHRYCCAPFGMIKEE